MTQEAYDKAVEVTTRIVHDQDCRCRPDDGRDEMYADCVSTYDIHAKPIVDAIAGVWGLQLP